MDNLCCIAYYPTDTAHSVTLCGKSTVLDTVDFVFLRQRNTGELFYLHNESVTCESCILMAFSMHAIGIPNINEFTYPINNHRLYVGKVYET